MPSAKSFGWTSGVNTIERVSFPTASTLSAPKQSSSVPGCPCQDILQLLCSRLLLYHHLSQSNAFAEDKHVGIPTSRREASLKFIICVDPLANLLDKGEERTPKLVDKTTENVDKDSPSGSCQKNIKDPSEGRLYNKDRWPDECSCIPEQTFCLPEKTWKSV